MNTENITDLPATSPLFLSHLVDTYGGSIQLQKQSGPNAEPNKNNNGRDTFSSHTTASHSGSLLDALPPLTHFIHHKKPEKTTNETEMVVY